MNKLKHNLNQFTLCNKINLYAMRIFSVPSGDPLANLKYSTPPGQWSWLNNEAVLLLYAHAGCFCWVMVFRVPTIWDTQTQGHTHYDTVEAVWLHQGPLAAGEERKSPTKMWLVSLSLSLPFFFCSLSVCLPPPPLLGSVHLSLFPLPSNQPICLSPSSPSGMFLS